MENGELQQQEKYVIFNPRECGFLNVFLSLFPDSPAPAIRCTPGLRARVDSSWQAKFSMWMMTLLHTVAKGLAMVEKFLELWLNTIHMNGGLVKMIFNVLTRTPMVIPQEGSDSYWSLVGLLDPRTDLLLQPECDEFRDLSSFFASQSPASKLIADACMMAAKLAYENKQSISKIVTQDWKMHLAGTFECINKYQPSNPTNFFILMDRAEDAQAIIVAFRGTMLFNAYDWSSNFDFSWYELPRIGGVHVGCLEALGLVDRQEIATFARLKRNISEKRTRGKQPNKIQAPDVAPGSIDEAKELSRNQLPEETPTGVEEADEAEEENIFEEARTESLAPDDEEILHKRAAENTPEEILHKNIIQAFENIVNPASTPRSFLSGLIEARSEDNKHLLAYDAACEKLRELLVEHKNAKLFITGHSLGGALATVFTSLLIHTREEEISSRLAAVYTFGQPKAGDNEFASNISIDLNYPENKYFRVVYSRDLVPRLPYDDLVFRFKHLGPCFFYTSNYEGETVNEEPNKSFNSSNLLPTHAAATWELLQSLMLRYKFGEAYKETLASTVFRLAGLLFPGVAAHSPVNYINAIRLGSEVLDSEVMPSLDNLPDEE